MSRHRDPCRDRDSRGRRSRLRQELELNPRNFRSQQKILVSRQDITELCHDREILCRDIVGQVGKIFCHDRGFLGRDRVGQAKGFLSQHNILMS